MPRFFIDRPVFAWVIALVIMLGGVLAFLGLPVAQYPEVAPPALSVTTVYPGASARVLEESVTSLIEQEMNGIEGLLYMESSSESTGNMTLTLTFKTGTNLDIASVEAQNRIKRVETRLPEEVRRQGVRVVKSRRNYLVFMSLISPDGSRGTVDLVSYGAANVIEHIRRRGRRVRCRIFHEDLARPRSPDHFQHDPGGSRARRPCPEHTDRNRRAG